MFHLLVHSPHGFSWKPGAQHSIWVSPMSGTWVPFHCFLRSSNRVLDWKGNSLDWSQHFYMMAGLWVVALGPHLLSFSESNRCETWEGRSQAVAWSLPFHSVGGMSRQPEASKNQSKHSHHPKAACTLLCALQHESPTSLLLIRGLF